VAFKTALSEEYNTQYRILESSTRIRSEDIGVTTGCNMAYLAVLMVLCPPGSSILLPLPAYFNITMSCSLQNVKPVYIPSLPQEGFKPSLSGARKHLEGDKNGVIRVIVLITPNNPTGAVYSPEELEQWFDLAKEFKIALLLDETYRDFVEDKEGLTGGKGSGRPHRLFERDDWRRTLISLSSMSSE
jgi:aspartate/methionine/tyrosine aminotransferase